MAVTQIDNLEKVKLDSEFSLVHSMNEQQLKNLADDYEMLKSRMVREIHDIADKLSFLYSEIRQKSPRGLR